jgi:hypothetical protein
MKKLFLLFAVFFALGCGDNAVEPNFNAKNNLHGGFNFDVNLNSAVESYNEAYLEPGVDILKIDLRGSRGIDTSFKKHLGLYSREFTNNGFKGSFLDTNSITHSINVQIINSNHHLTGEFILSNNSVEILKVPFTAKRTGN